LFSGKLNGLSLVWGDSMVWGDSNAGAFSIIWGDSVNGNIPLMALSGDDDDQ